MLPEHAAWLEDVAPIMTRTERDVFRKLSTSAEREKFIRFFWRARDPNPDTVVNEFEQEYAERIRFADQTFGRGSVKRGSQTERGFFYLLLGKPLERQIFATQSQIWPLELWFCKGDEAAGMPPYFYLIFFQPEGNGDFRLYSPGVDGPQKLVVPLMYGETASSKGNAMEFIKNVSSELASASKSYMPEETVLGSTSMASDLIIAAIKRAPEKKYSDAYARSYMDLKDHIETEYSDQYLNGSYLVKVFRNNGLAFVNWAIEPDKMNFVSDGKMIRASFELVLKIEDKAGVSVFERTEEIPLRLTPEQYRSHEKQRFSFQDVLPLIPGEYRMFFLLKNKTGKDFSTFHTEIAVPIAGGPSLVAPLLFLASEDVPASMAGKSKAFLIGGRQYVVGARNEFINGSSLGVLVQAWNMPGTGTYEVEIVSLDTTRPNAVYPLTASPAGGKDPGAVNASAVIPLTSFPPGYYRADVSYKDAFGKKTLSRSDNFVILSAPIPVTPWVYARMHQEAPSAEDMKVLGQQYFLNRDYERAVTSLQGALAGTEDPGARLLLAKSFYGLGRFRETVDNAVIVYGRTGDKDTAKVLALGHFGLREWDKALVYLDRILAEATEIPVLNLAAECHMNLGRYDLALVLLKKSLSLVPDQPAIRELEEKVEKISGRSEKES